MGALIVVVSCLSRSGHQPSGSRDEVSTCTLRKHLVVFVEGTDGGLEKTPRTIIYSSQPRRGIGARGVDGGLDGEVLLQDLGVDTNGSHRDLIRSCDRDLLLRCQMLLEILAILRAPWLRPVLIWWRGR